MSSSSTNRSFYPMIIMSVLFFSFGFVTWLNGTLIPFLRIVCELKSDTQSFFVTFAFYIAYFVLALPSAVILKKTGYKLGMGLGLVIIALGSLVFIPASNSRSFTLFLCGLFVQGAGLALLQTASNPYIAMIGPIESAAKRISIMGICNKTAGIISPIILASTILKNAGVLETQINATKDMVSRNQLLAELSSRIIFPYVIISIILVLAAIMILLSGLPEINQEKITVGAEKKNSVEEKSIFQFPYLWLGVVCLFLYVGVEVMAGDAIGTYGKAIGLPLNETRYFTSFTLFAMLLGYTAGIFLIPKKMSQQKGLTISAITGIVFTIFAFLTHGYISIFFIALLGLSNALMWPAIFPLAIDGLGKHTKTGSAFLVMSIAGGAIIPLIYSWLKDSVHISNHWAFFVCMAPSYVYIYYYSVAGYKHGKA